MHRRARRAAWAATWAGVLFLAATYFALDQLAQHMGV